ncbi:MAG: glycosyltransferase family 4 protein [Geminicoccaceae bacterium]
MSGLFIRMMIPGLPITSPDPLAVGLGGSETAGLQLAAELARQGHRVEIACNTPEPFTWRDARLQHGFNRVELAQPYDLLLAQRAPNLLKERGGARAAFLWLHDQPGPGVRGWVEESGPRPDRFLFVSRWHAEQHRALALDLADRFTVIRNGIDLDLIADAAQGVERDPFRIAYISRPERGLDVLLTSVLPRLLAAEPRTSLSIAAYASGLPAEGCYEEELYSRHRGAGEAVTWHGGLGKRDLYRLLAGCGLVLYPTPAPVLPGFAETSCIAAMEAMACGAVWVSTDRGALPETVGDAGVLVPIGDATHAGHPDAVDAMAAAALRVMREPEHAERLRMAGLARAAGFGWAPVAEQLVELARAVPEPPRSVPAPTTVRSKGHVAIATPVYGHLMHAACTRSLLHTSARLGAAGYGVSWLTNSLSSIRHARNQLAALFLEHDETTHIMWVDADLSFPGDAVLRLLAHDVDMIGGIYPFKKLPLEYGFSPASDDHGNTRQLASGAVEAEVVPGGFVLVRREVFLAIIEAFPERALARSAQQRHQSGLVPWWFDFYPEVIENGILVTEDFAFCRAWRSIGGTVWADLSIRLTHHGMHAFVGDPLDLIQAEPAEAVAA